MENGRRAYLRIHTPASGGTARFVTRQTIFTARATLQTPLRRDRLADIAIVQHLARHRAGNKGLGSRSRIRAPEIESERGRRIQQRGFGIIRQLLEK